MNLRLPFASLPILSLLALGAGACNPSPAILSYRQLGACNDFAPGLLQAGANKALVFFRMDSMDNTQSNTPLSFDPFKLEVTNLTNVPGEGRIDQTLTNQWAQALQGPPAGPVTVPAQTAQQLHGWGVMLVPTSTPDGAVEANMTPYFLVDAPLSGILPVKEDSSRTSWPYTPHCGSIDFAQQ